MRLSLENNNRNRFEEHLIVTSNSGKMLGEIQEIHLGFSASIGGEPTVYVACRYCGKPKCLSTRMEAFNYLGVSAKEVDAYYDSPLYQLKRLLESERS